MESPKVPNHEILGAQHLSLHVHEKISLTSRPQAKVSHLWHSDASTAVEHSPGRADEFHLHLAFTLLKMLQMVFYLHVIIPFWDTVVAYQAS